MENKDKTIIAENKWNRELERKIKEYKYVKQVYLDSNIIKDIEFITKIKYILDNENIENENEFGNILEANKIFKLENGTEFSIRRIQYFLKEGKFEIKDCVILFLFYKKNNFFKLLNTEYRNTKLKFSVERDREDLRDTCTKFLQDILSNDNCTVKLEEKNLINFFENKTVVYCKEIRQNEIKTLKNIQNSNISGIIVTFISPEDMFVNEISNLMNNIITNLSPKLDSTIMYASMIDKEYKEPMVRIILVE